MTVHSYVDCHYLHYTTRMRTKVLFKLSMGGRYKPLNTDRYYANYMAIRFSTDFLMADMVVQLLIVCSSDV